MGSAPSSGALEHRHHRLLTSARSHGSLRPSRRRVEMVLSRRTLVRVLGGYGALILAAACSSPPSPTPAPAKTEAKPAAAPAATTAPAPAAGVATAAPTAAAATKPADAAKLADAAK